MWVVGGITTGATIMGGTTMDDWVVVLAGSKEKNCWVSWVGDGGSGIDDAKSDWWGDEENGGWK